MKKLFLLCTLFMCNLIFAQVGIGTTNPNASSQLDINSNDKGILIPQVELTSLTDTTTITNGNVDSLLIYNIDSSPISAGYYYWSNATWNRLMTDKQAVMPKFFYMPSIAIPTSTAHFVTGDGFTESGGVFRVNLHTRYSTEFGTPKASNPGKTTTLPNLLANELDFYVTDYDTTVFENVTVSNAGVLTYEIKNNAQVTAATFMNIIFAVKP